MFPITMSFTVSTPAELARLVAATGNIAPPEVSALPVEKPKAETVPKKGTNVAKEGTPDPKPETAAASAALPAATPDTKGTTDAAAGAIDFTSQIQKPIVAMAAGGRRTEALAILKELGAGKASEIKPADYARAVELIAKAG